MFTDTVMEDNGHIFVKPLCDFFEIEYKNQVEKIRNDEILANSFGKNRNNSLFGDNYPRVSLDKKGFIRWIQTIKPSTVRECFRESFIQYQNLIFDYLYGSAEKHERIRMLNVRLQKRKSLAGKLGAYIQQDQKELINLLNDVYQYRIDFKQNNAIEK